MINTTNLSVEPDQAHGVRVRTEAFNNIDGSPSGIPRNNGPPPV